MKRFFCQSPSIRILIGWLTTMCCLSAWAAPGKADQPIPLTAQEKEQASQLNNILRRAVEQVLPAVVSLQVSKQIESNPFAPEGNKVPGIGSGFIFDKKGYVITNNHVVADTEKILVVLADGRTFEAADKLLDPDTDLAVVRFDPKGQDLPVAKLGDSDQLEVGNLVLAMGSPFGFFTQTVTSGIVSYKGRQTHILDQWGYEDFIQTDAEISKGNSGGPLVNLNGEVIGINSNIISTTGISSGYGFAVPSNLAKFVSDQLIAQGKVKRGWLGISMHGLAELRKLPKDILNEHVLKKFPGILDGVPDSLDGVLVMSVNKGEPADQAGVKSKDVILAVNDRKTTDSKSLRNYIATLPPGTSARCDIWRDGKTLSLDVTLGDRDLAKAKEPQSLELPTPGKKYTYKLPAKETLGIGVKELEPELAQKYGYPPDTPGVLIEHVIPDSLAQQCGLKAGDVILAAAGEKTTSISQLRKIVSDADLDEKGLELEILNAEGRRHIVIKQTPNL